MVAAARLSIEVYSFVSLVASFSALLLWLAWVFVPDSQLQSWGVSYYPDKWWALALPTYVVTALAFVMYMYVALCLKSVCRPDCLDMIRDGSTPVTDVLYRDEDKIPDIQDVSLATVNRYLFPARGSHQKTG
mmetsp:Transcript_22074/g.50435  ORF Transcript_22074/g.50435 Transcript_22074/m.50435 type:complete len:132 (+) Transcript_22074:216-611(+)